MKSASDSSGQLDLFAAAARIEDPIAALGQLARSHTARLGLTDLTANLTVVWNPRLGSTAGRAWHKHRRIELNPALQNLPGDESERTLLHELAHLVSHARAGKRRILPHGPEWRRACADLGIPNERATHRLPLPKRTVTRRHFYQCPGCKQIFRRVLAIRNKAACAACCRKHARGRYDPKFTLQRIAPPVPAA